MMLRTLADRTGNSGAARRFNSTEGSPDQEQRE